jgi:hypothetical protein
MNWTRSLTSAGFIVFLITAPASAQEAPARPSSDQDNVVVYSHDRSANFVSWPEGVFTVGRPALGQGAYYRLHFKRGGPQRSVVQELWMGGAGWKIDLLRLMPRGARPVPERSYGGLKASRGGKYPAVMGLTMPVWLPDEDACVSFSVRFEGLKLQFKQDLSEAIPQPDLCDL